MNIFDDIYSEVISRIQAATFYGSDNQNKVKAGNLIEYSTGENTRLLSSSADYPKIELRWVSVGVEGGTSGMARYKPTLRIVVRTGNNSYQARLTPILYELLKICDTLRRWRHSDAESQVVSCDHNGVANIGKFYDESGSDQISGWSFEIDLAFLVYVKHETE